MEQFVVQCLGRFLDFGPYAAGRAAIFVLTWNSVPCERWQPIAWGAPIFPQRLWRRVGGEFFVTHWGARCAGVFVMIAAGIAAAFGTLWFVLKM